MVTIIKTGHSIRAMLNYNENKIKEGKAECIGQGNYPVDADRLTYAMKLRRLEKQCRLNENVKRNTVHISLNFDPSEARLPKEKLLEIAGDYMEKIGFGNQPYLIYQHYDAGHPHIHITSINVQENGKRIAMHNIGKDISEPARKEIEDAFNLVKVENQKKKEYKPESVSARVQYGKTETKKAIENVLNFVVNNYKYTSLAELNAALKLYNIEVDKGAENSRIAKHKGLLYHALDEKGNRVGVPIKASMFYDKPILMNLEKKFTVNQIKRQSDKSRIKSSIDTVFLKGNIIILPQLIKQLQKDGIDTVLRHNADGLVYGVTFVDHKTKSVFNGSNIGKEYSAKGLQDKCNSNQLKTASEGEKVAFSKQELIEILEEYKDKFQFNELPKFIDLLMKSENDYQCVPKEFKSRRNKKHLRG
ncbi:relaxase/mobilization nuclease domain-containing protein [Flavobacterium rakeshii]|uniref:relaxase/mobilization nuclease domain-containing protein n=1 Tax=Flavobacterium rakeshii TaxID=1038845 RepID=UPI002E7AD5DB|nr:relaxase/mobilization nuclease domain-containing protein [Flavobacterium rakeshii]MEE1898690.1 relaxase/mobilization nuclease domain-containing protein [Flavobacterium rakeshii]